MGKPIVRYRAEDGVIHEIRAIQGADGVSPTVSMEAVDGGVRITITDAEGEHTGVVYVPGFCTAISDWNALDHIGWVIAENATNAPADGVLLGRCIAAADGIIVQEAYEINASKHYIRRCSGGTWTVWAEQPESCYTKAEIENRFYPKDQVDVKLGTKSNTSHNHDGAYYKGSGSITISSGNPTGGSNGDIWLQW